MPELPERIVDQNETTWITATDNATRRRQEAKGTFPRRFQITENGATGYLWSEIAAWIAARAADRTLSKKTAAASAALAERHRVAAHDGGPTQVRRTAPGADIEEQPPAGARRGRAWQPTPRAGG